MQLRHMLVTKTLTIFVIVVCACTSPQCKIVAAADNVLTEAALISAGVRDISVPPNQYDMSAGNAVNGYLPQRPDTLQNYSRGRDGQWQIPQEVDQTDPWIRLLVLAPERPMLIDLAVYLDGEPYAAAREKLIDDLMSGRKIEPPAQESADSSPDTSDQVTSESETDTDNLNSGELNVTESDEGSGTESDESKDGQTATGSESEQTPPLMEIKLRQQPTVSERLLSYKASAGAKADREEIRWLLAEWSGGPAVLTLGAATSWQRVGFAPLWNVLDVDGDDALNAQEIAAAIERLSQTDVDENSIVEVEELFAVKSHSTTMPHSYPLMVILDQTTDWRQLRNDLQIAYAAKSRQQGNTGVGSALLSRISTDNTGLSEAELAGLMDEAVDFRIRVDFQSDATAESKLALITSAFDQYSAAENTITVGSGAAYVEISAGQTSMKDVSEAVATQISIGAVVDGYPLFRLADRNGDRRLSPRECRNVAKLLPTLDLDNDGQISRTEKPTAIRIAIARGPYAHMMVAEPSSGQHKFDGGETTLASGSAKSGIEAPVWFKDMDRNGDGDLSRDEFLGTSEQYRQLDRDGDGLVSTHEASTN